MVQAQEDREHDRWIARTTAGHSLSLQFCPQVWPMNPLCRKCQKPKSLTFSAMDLAMKNYMYKESKKNFTIHLKLFHQWLSSSLSEHSFCMLCQHLETLTWNPAYPSAFFPYIHWYKIRIDLLWSRGDTETNCLAISMSFKDGIPTWSTSKSKKYMLINLPHSLE